jgi:C4-dicarboxylate-specific signal transduction histidine kinase
MTEKALDRIARTVERIAKIVRGLRMFARDAGNDPMLPAAVDELVRETLAFCETRLRNHGVDLRVAIPAEAPIIACRSAQISQVLLNLLNNALDAVSGLPDPWVEIAAMRRAGSVEIAVSNSGPPVPAEVRAKMFHPFFTTKESGKGTGLGLSIARGIAAAHHGTLTFDDAAAHPRFVLTLPEPREAAAA